MKFIYISAACLCFSLSPAAVLCQVPPDNVGGGLPPLSSLLSFMAPYGPGVSEKCANDSQRYLAALAALPGSGLLDGDGLW